MFTAHPVTGSRKHALISACYGAGEGIVSGVCNTDEYTISLENQTLEKQITDKDTQLVLDTQTGNGIIQTSVEERLRNQACLKEEESKALAQLGEQIAIYKGASQDIEWTLKNGKFYILQTRPITSKPAPAKPIGETVVWDNSNIILSPDDELRNSEKIKCPCYVISTAGEICSQPKKISPLVEMTNAYKGMITFFRVP